LPTTTLKRIKDTQDIPKYSLSYVIRVAAHIGLVEETRTSFSLTKIGDRSFLRRWLRLNG
ncbi:hypothetical protein BAE44_0025613, partial [Dichanthelium oligosanthes]